MIVLLFVIQRLNNIGDQKLRAVNFIPLSHINFMKCNQRILSNCYVFVLELMNGYCTLNWIHVKRLSNIMQCMTSTRIWIDFQQDCSDHSIAATNRLSPIEMNFVSIFLFLCFAFSDQWNVDLEERIKFIHTKELKRFNNRPRKHTFKSQSVEIVLTASETCKPFTVVM